MWTLLVVALALVSSCAGKVDYTGYQIIKASAPSIEDLKFIEAEESPLKLSVWEYSKYPSSVTFLVHPDLAVDIKARLHDKGFPYLVLTADLQLEIDIESSENARVQARADDTWFESYHPIGEIMVWLLDQEAACGDGCSIIDIGESYENRPMWVFKMTGEDNNCQTKPAIYIDSGIHAREWLSYTTGMFILDRLLQDYETDDFVKQMRDSYDWYFLTGVNPDGYAYTWTTDRMWRKTRQPVSGSICLGTDANRNFDFMWMTTGASNNPCSETFAGPFAYSEPEAKAVADFLMSKEGQWDLFITLHTYGQLWMTPWGYTEDLPDDYEEMARVGAAAVQTILETSGTVYTMGSAANILYESSGTSRDYAKGVPNIPYVYTIELRNLNSFVLPPTEIIPTGEEIWAALKTTVEKMQEKHPPTCK